MIKLSDVIIRHRIIIPPLTSRGSVTVVVRNTEDNFLEECICGQYGLSICQNTVRVNLESLTGCIPLASEVDPDLIPLEPIIHGNLNKVGGNVLSISLSISLSI